MSGRLWCEALVVGCVASANACGEGRGPSSEIQVDTLESGLIQVINDRDGSWSPDVAWRVEEDLRLGSIDAPGPELFSQVAAILTDDQNRIYVLDSPSQEIRVFSAIGESLYEMGGEGEGPGELTSAAGLNWGPDGHLWVWGSSQYVVMDPSGEEVARYARGVRGVIYSWMGGFDDGGRYVDWGLDRERIGGIPTGRTWYYPVRFTPPDQFDTLPPLEFRAQVTEDGRLKIGRKNIEAALYHGSLWFAHSDAYTIYKRGLEGDTVLTFTLPSEPMPVPESEMDSVIAVWEDQIPPDQQMTHEHFASYRPVVGNIRTDEVGRVYVFPQEEGLVEGEAVDVFEDSGAYLGRIRFPEPILTESPSPHIAGDYLYAVVQSELEVPFVVRYRIIKPE